jgi:hypothetical protein
MPLRSDFSIDALTPSAPNADGRTLHDEAVVDLNTEFETRTLITRARRKSDIPIDLESLEVADLFPHRRRVAFLVTHGMGQQVPFETVSMLGQALLTQHGAQGHAAPAANKLHANLRRVRLTALPDAPELSRVEVTLTADEGEEVDVHLYESYWAPFTEGQISFTATVGFLYEAAWNGIKTSVSSRKRATGSSSEEMTVEQKDIADKNKRSDGMKHFDRWMFGKFHDMPIKRWTFRILVALVVVLALLLLPALMVFTPAGIAAVKYLWNWWKPIYEHWPVSFHVGAVALAVLFLTFALIVRYLVVEFVGDVAIYVSSYKVSRYDDIRSKILNEVMGVARQIYSAGIADRTQPRYDDVVIVGHSLGSVISYDLLNWCINWDQVENNFKHQVVGRTKRLITFGSPLDKTAFLFRTQVSSARSLREALAARQQPLILDYEKFRPLETFRWINIFSPADIISGSLEYYDVEGLPGYNGVVNVKDPQATTPLLAHIQYWDNAELHQQLYDAAWAGVQTSAINP